MKKLVLTSVAALAIAACGSSDGAASTATKGDQFCRLAQTAKDDNDALDTMDINNHDTVKLQFGAAIDSLSAAAAKAPKDIKPTVDKLLADEERLEVLLKQNDYDVNKLAATDEGRKLIEEADSSTTGDDFKQYLNDKCGIVSADDSSDTSIEPVGSEPAPDATVPDVTVPDVTVAPDDSASAGDQIDLGEGEAAINKFLDLYELGTGAKLSDEDRSCIVGKLSGTVTGDDLNEAINDEASEELKQALGLAFLGCNVEVQS